LFFIHHFPLLNLPDIFLGSLKDQGSGFPWAFCYWIWVFGWLILTAVNDNDENFTIKVSKAIVNGYLLYFTVEVIYKFFWTQPEEQSIPILLMFVITVIGFCLYKKNKKLAVKYPRITLDEAEDLVVDWLKLSIKTIRSDLFPKRTAARNVKILAGSLHLFNHPGFAIPIYPLKEYRMFCLSERQKNLDARWENSKTAVTNIRNYIREYEQVTGTKLGGYDFNWILAYLLVRNAKQVLAVNFESIPGFENGKGKNKKGRGARKSKLRRMINGNSIKRRAPSSAELDYVNTLWKKYQSGELDQWVLDAHLYEFGMNSSQFEQLRMDAIDNNYSLMDALRDEWSDNLYFEEEELEEGWEEQDEEYNLYEAYLDDQALEWLDTDDYDEEEFYDARKSIKTKLSRKNHAKFDETNSLNKLEREIVEDLTKRIKKNREKTRKNLLFEGTQTSKRNRFDRSLN